MRWHKHKADFSLQARMIARLVFIPLHALKDALEALERIDPVLQQAVHLFEIKYVGASPKLVWCNFFM